MKKYILRLSIFTFLISCSSHKTIDLKYKCIKKLKIEQMTTSYVALTGEIILKKSNFKDGYISAPKGLAVFFDNEKITDINIQDFKVADKRKISIPIRNVSIDYNSIYDKNGGFLRLTLDAAKSKPILVRIEGELIANSNGSQKKIGIIHSEEVKLED